MKNQIANMSIGDTVTLRGKCTGVGEILGYSVKLKVLTAMKKKVKIYPTIRQMMNGVL